MIFMSCFQECTYMAHQRGGGVAGQRRKKISRSCCQQASVWEICCLPSEFLCQLYMVCPSRRHPLCCQLLLLLLPEAISRKLQASVAAAVPIVLVALILEAASGNLPY
jgi:hypothetical protein